MIEFAQGYALIIGVGADLSVTATDATGVATILLDPTRCAYPTDHVKLLTEEQACRHYILEGLDWLAATAKQDDTVLIYFSGHGIEAPDYYLMPYGYDLTNLTDTAIEGHLFTEKLRAIHAKKLLVLLDCCHAGGQAEAKDAVKSPLPLSAFEKLRKSSGRVIIASSRRNEQSWTGQPYSVFTAALLEGLAGYGAFEQDGYARILDIAMWISRKVPERTGDKQHPILKVNNLADNFAVSWYAGGGKSVSPLSWTIHASNVDSKVNAVQGSTWGRMLANYQGNLLLIEERMSEYVEYNDIPLQLVKNRRQTEDKIFDLEQRLGLA